ncbi:MAG: rane protein [Paenibacillus sp.]|nr:rane protein [Paenibacillus sp.]
MQETFGGILNVLIGVAITGIMMVVGFAVFSFITKYNDMAEIKKGNKAAGIYMGTKLLGIGIIIAFASYSSHSWLLMVVWGLVGIVILAAVYWIFDKLTFQFNVCQEIQNGNEAVARLMQGVIIGVSIAIGTFLL